MTGIAGQLGDHWWVTGIAGQLGDCLRIWESLPADLQKEENQIKFKTEVNKILL